MPVATTVGEQSLEAVVAGPDGATLLHTCTGFASVQMNVNTAVQQIETWSFLVGPTLTRTQFFRAIADASVSTYLFNSAASQPGSVFSISVTSVEADWDAESSRVEVHVEVTIFAGPGSSVSVNALRYWVTILAQAPPASPP
jgi:hypothetical protein